MVLLGKRKIRMPKIIDQINKSNSHLTKFFNIKSTCMNALKNIIVFGKNRVQPFLILR